MPLCQRYIWMILVVAILTGCKNDISEINAITDPQHLPVQTTYGAEYKYSVNGKLRNLLQAAQLDRIEGEEKVIKAEGGFTIVFFDSLQNESARLSAQHGTFQEEENKLIAWEKVHVKNIRNEFLDTEELIFVQDSDRIYTDKFVSITTQNGVFNGRGLESNASFTKFKILQPSGDIYMNDPQKK